MLAADPAMSAAEALVSLHTAPIHTATDAQDLLEASQTVRSPNSLPVTDKHMDWQPSAPADDKLTNAAMDWQASAAKDSDNTKGGDRSSIHSAREQQDEAKLGLGLGALDGLTEDVSGRFEALREDIMAVDGSMDLDSYLLSTYDVHAPTYVELEDRGRKKHTGGPAAASSSKGRAAGGGRRKAGNGIKLKPLNEINLLRSTRRAPPASSEERTPLPSIRAILQGKPPIQPSRSSIAPAAGPHGEVPYGVYRIPEALPIDAHTGRPYYPAHMSRGRVISHVTADGRPIALVRGPMVRTAPVPIADPLSRSTRWLQSAPSGSGPLDASLLTVRPPPVPCPGAAVSPHGIEGVAVAAEGRSIKRRASGLGLPPSHHQQLHPAPPPPHVDELVHRQQHHIAELHQQNVWLQQQLLAQAAAAAGGGPRALLPGGRSTPQPNAPAGATVAVAAAPCPRRPCTPCPHHQHSHLPIHPVPPSQQLYRHQHHHAFPAPHAPLNPHKKKPYSVPDAVLARPRTKHAVAATTATASHNQQQSSPLASAVATSASTAPVPDAPPTPHLPSPVSPKVSGGADAAQSQPMHRQQPQQQALDPAGGHRQAIAKLGEFLRKGSASGQGSMAAAAAAATAAAAAATTTVTSTMTPAAAAPVAASST
ncbi:hypothetical protein BDZ88DRAFT_404617 [Geranomyces variabilis]|nr:hypothetical protein BDZ88DRAFT_404617 [Geranomyces variabilis]KAJ3143451.1 hypothetical protein HDU90_000212 [Geranomyces variabilis]